MLRDRFNNKYDIKVCDDGMLIQLLIFFDIICYPVFILKWYFGDWTVSPSLG
jgi:hypothetical protein